MSAGVLAVILWFVIGTALFGRTAARHLPEELEGVWRFVTAVLVGLLAASMLFRFVVWVTH